MRVKLPIFFVACRDSTESQRYRFKTISYREMHERYVDVWITVTIVKLMCLIRKQMNCILIGKREQSASPGGC